jgi:hypothetical protein
MATKTKNQVKTKEQPVKFLAPVPDEFVFWCSDGKVFKDVKQLAEGLKSMSDGTYSYHCNMEKNDFYRWVKDVIKDDRLASDLATAITREQALKAVNSRLTALAGR